MYQIISAGGTVIGAAETIRYIRKGTNGCYIPASQQTATGIAFKGEPYNLPGNTDFGGADTVVVAEFNGAEQMAAQGGSITETADALCEMDIYYDQRIADIEDALCEMDI